MQVLVTGTTGFVGSHLVSDLSAAGYEGRVLVCDPVGYDAPPDVDAASFVRSMRAASDPAERVPADTRDRNRHQPPPRSVSQ